MMTLARVLLAGLGAWLVVVGLTRIAWNLWAWAWLSQHGHRPWLYPDGRARVYYKLEALAAALGACALAAALAI